MSTGMNATRSATKVLLRERRLEPKVNIFAQLSDLGPVLNKPLLFKRVTEGAQLLGDFCDFVAKIAILTPFESDFARFKTISIITVNC